MIRAELKDKNLITQILTKSFNENRSVNYIIKQDNKREKRLRSLMEYSFDVCHLFGDVFLTEDRKGCALVVLPDKKKTNLKSILLDLKLIFTGTGLSNVKKAMEREAKIKKLQPNQSMYYLWFIGVDPAEQHKGIGSALLRDVIKEGLSKKRTICLETSTLTNIPWYEKFGFNIYNTLDLGYRLYFLKRE
jgi:GNAT superfamily N-acetyltransferase